MLGFCDSVIFSKALDSFTLRQVVTKPSMLFFPFPDEFSTDEAGPSGQSAVSLPVRVVASHAVGNSQPRRPTVLEVLYGN